jgi:hypothetical protein
MIELNKDSKKNIYILIPLLMMQDRITGKL